MGSVKDGFAFDYCIGGIAGGILAGLFSWAHGALYSYSMTASKPEEVTAPAPTDKEPAAITAGAAAERETKPAQETSNITAEKNEGADEENAATSKMDQQENADNAEGDK